MRILFDARPAIACKSGIGRYAATLAELSCDLGQHDVQRLGLDLRLQARSHLDEEIALPALLARGGFDLYHSPFFQLPAILPCPAVITIHDAVPVVRPELTSPEFAALFSASARSSAERAAAIVCPSEFARAEVAAALGVDPSKVHAVPECPAALFSRERPRPRTGHTLSPFLLSVGPYEQRKNQDCVLEALSRLADRTLRAVFVGSGTDDGRLEAEAERRGLRERCRILGHVSDDELHGLYRAAEAVVVASRHEGFGLPVIEAFAVGTPVIHSRAGALPEVAGPAGLSFDPDAPEELATQLERLALEPELSGSLVDAGRSRLANRYSARAVRAALESLYAALQGVTA